MARTVVSVLLAVVMPMELLAQEVELIELGADPEVVIGSIEGEPEYQFQFLVDAERLPSGEYLAADRTDGTVRIYDASGRFIRSFGGRGEGPSEFRYLDRIIVIGDTVLVFDPMQLKAARFDLRGELLSTERTPPQLQVLGLGESGEIWWSWLVGQVPGPHPDILADEIAIGRSAMLTGPVEEVAQTTGLWRSGGSPYPFSPLAGPRLYGDSLLIPNREGGLAIVDRDGLIARVIRPPMTSPDRDAAWETLEGALRGRGQLQLLERASGLPRVDLPTFGAVMTDEGRIWVKDFDPPEDAHWLGGWAGGEGGSWSILDRDGTLLGRVHLGARVVPLRVRDGFLLGRLRDDLDVQYLVAYRVPPFG